MDADFVAKQQKVLSLFYHPEQVNPEADYYKIGKDYDIEKCIDDYTVSLPFLFPTHVPRLYASYLSFYIYS